MSAAKGVNATTRFDFWVGWVICVWGLFEQADRIIGSMKISNFFILNVYKADTAQTCNPTGVSIIKAFTPNTWLIASGVKTVAGVPTSQRLP
jgi:hypothetical protein